MDYRSIIESRYNRENWQKLLHHIFNGREKFWNTPSPVNTSSRFAKQVLWLGTITLSDEQTIAVYEVELADSVDIERNRRGIRDMLLSEWRGNGNAGAFMFCYRKNESVLRFSYVSEAWTFAEDGTYQKESTDAKRFTYLLGEGHRSRTAIQQFEKLKESSLNLEALTKAFSVDAVSDMFFKEYKKNYEDIIFYVTGKRMVKVSNKWEERREGEPCEEIMQEFAHFPNPEKAVRDYVKKLMGRLVFLQFLQKKGWLGVRAGQPWGSGDGEFVQHLFADCRDKDHFVDNVLEALFNDLDSEDEIAMPQYRTPYLNGGLFERDASDESNFPLPAKYMQQLLDFYSSYNFTIDENDPDDAEVGVDPEMLGRIFENLLEDNKDKGAFYTPKEIVSYMCRESLIAYLQTDIDDDATKEAIRKFVTTHDANMLGVITNDVDQRLKDVKICDPAIGSGAFPMGLLKELFQCRSAIEGIDQSTAAEIKKHIIQNNIYGVDIEKGAVDIARLRFWLSLIVDEETPQALPNLDFKIMRGNSLLEQYNGFDLSTIMHSKKKVEGPVQMTFFEDNVDVLRRQVIGLRRSYYRETNKLKKKNLRQQMRDIVQQQINALSYNVDLSKIDIADNSEFFLWHTWFADVFEKGGFDIVIGNPPWGADLSKDSKALLKTAYSEIDSSTPNSYAYFIGWGLKNCLSSLMYVLPDSILIKDFRKTRELISPNVREVLWYQNCGVPRDKRIFRDVEHDVCVICLDKSNHVYAHFQTNNYEDGCYVPKDNFVAKDVVLKKEFDYVFNLKASATDWKIASKLLAFQPLSAVAQCHEGIHSGNIREKLFVMGNKSNMKPLFYGGKAGDIIRPYVSYMSGWYVDYRPSIINQEAGEYASLRDERLFVLPKIYVTRTGNPFKAFYDNNSYASNNFFSLQLKDYDKNNKDNLLFLLPFINSKVCQFFIRSFAAPRLGESFIETKIIHLLKFPIPQVAQSEKSKLIALVEEIIKAKEANQNADTADLEDRANSLIYQFYGLAEDEIKIIEQS